MELIYDPSQPAGLRLEKVYNVKLDDAIAYAKSREAISLKKGDVIYFTPLVKTVRFKLKALCDKLEIKGTNKIETADYIFVNDVDKYNSYKSSSNKQIQFPRYFVLRSGSYKNNFIECIDGSSKIPSVGDRLYDPKLSEELYSTPFEVIINEENYDLWHNFYREKTERWAWIGYAFDKINFVSLPNPSLLSKLRHEDQLTSLINEDAIIITDEKYEELKRMFASNDEENIVLAMEIMANSNYEESILNNYLLLVQNSYLLYRLRESNHKNFQSLLNFYGLNLRSMTRRISNKDVDEIADFLKCHGKFTKEAMEKLLHYYRDVNYEYVGKYCNSLLIPNKDIEYDGFE